MNKMYPLKLEAQLLEKIWGGHWLSEKLGRPAKEGQLLGESWEAFSGSRVSNGVWAGRTLGELYQEYKAEIGGEVANTYPEFPLLVKFIDARENLSVQVHPDDALAQKLEHYRSGKTEMWYIMAAEPDAYILFGLTDKAASASNSELGVAFKTDAILEYISRVAVKAGDVVYLPSGTVHALCAGIVVYELQQESDITYRLYDWGRPGREMHYEKGLQATDVAQRNLMVSHPTIEKNEKGDGFGSVMLLECPYFTDELLEVYGQLERTGDGRSFTLLSVLAGTGSIVSPDGSFAAETIHTGDTVLLPSRLHYRLKADSVEEPLRLIAAQANH